MLIVTVANKIIMKYNSRSPRFVWFMHGFEF
jgi:hypothetical protein